MCAEFGVGFGAEFSIEFDVKIGVNSGAELGIDFSVQIFVDLCVKFGINFSAEFDFGSGTTNSFEAQDVVKIGNMNVPNQVFWEVYEAKMPILMKDSFQAILGVGPPTSAAKFAEFDVQKIHEEVAA